MKKSNHLLYKTYYGMCTRCTNPNATRYSDYGGRGITVCERWLNSFEAFVQDMGPRPLGYTLERVKNDLGYSPENCVWASRKTQANNRRRRRMNVTFRPNSCIRRTPDGYRVSIHLQPRRPQYHKHFTDLTKAREHRDELIYEREFHRALGL